MTDPTYSPAMAALFGPPTPAQRLEWLDGLCATRTATPEQKKERNRLQLRLAREMASAAFQAAVARFGEARARQAFNETLDREANRPANQPFNAYLLETYDWFEEMASQFGIRGFRKRAVELVAGASGRTEGAVEKQLERLLGKRKS